MAGWTFGEASVRENFRNILLAFTKFLFSEGCQRIAKFNAKMLDFVRSSSRTSTIDSLFVEVFVCPASCRQIFFNLICTDLELLASSSC